MQDLSVEFASLLCSRLCHDLLSPVGSMINGLELIADEQDPELRAQYMGLLTDSAEASANKLKFFRLAFGAAGGYGDHINANEAKAAIEGLVRGNARIVFGWLVDQPELSRGATRILLNLSLIALDALVRGGRLDVGVEADEVVVRAEGPRLVLDAELRALLDGGEMEGHMSSRTSGALLIRELARREGREVRLSEQDGVLLFGVTARGTAGAA
ncbi:histidine phosphotransferase [Sphingomonas sp. AP4-R1]|uniref:histidine phosphotransferase family protein n=1 Tax=Sphingomonas sp. AP4-R1 TaxID=2735134 RepID=UPI001493C169|nr:histidine phosphotransferase family protein [Sphingomonas sp. AP4-R1]QJU59619.1 histidine phosphotransferase [Sphingomonas sp. AP4-R1]